MQKMTFPPQLEPKCFVAASITARLYAGGMEWMGTTAVRTSRGVKEATSYADTRLSRLAMLSHLVKETPAARLRVVSRKLPSPECRSSP